MENQEDDVDGTSSSMVVVPGENEVLQPSMEDGSDDGDMEEEMTSDEKSISSAGGPMVKSGFRDVSLSALVIPDEIDLKVETIPQTPTPFAIPSLRGSFKLSSDSSKYFCKGLWAMSDALHEVPGQTSDFEFKLVYPPLSPNCKLPVSGKYTGWFILQQPNQKNPVKVEDKEINIQFELIDDGNHKIEGEGYNRFGKFSVYGTLSSNGQLQMYRSYTPKPLSTTNKSKKVSSSKKSPRPNTPRIPLASPAAGAPAGPNSKHASKVANSTIPALPVATSASVPPLSARSRRTSFSGIDVQESQNDEPSTSRDSRDSLSVLNVGGSKDKDTRSPRLTHHMLRCSEMLKDLTRQPQAIWFSEPVDYIKLNIPDYPNIIKEPMDFKTIRINLEQCIYKSPEEFAEHIRLTFRNAVTYNTSRDNPVHIAAREMSNRFEEKFRAMMSQMSASFDFDASSRGAVPQIGVGQSSKKSKKNSVPKRTGPGPRAIDEDGVALPVTMDNNMLVVMDELNRKIREMQSEILQLRSAVKNGDTKHEKPEKVKKSQALEPLTLEEKRALISRIHKLAPDRMAKVVDIIQSALPPSDRDDSDEVEIPLDELDTKTLRKLQDYVQSAPTVQSSAPKRKRQVAPSGTHSSVGRPPSTASAAPTATTTNGPKERQPKRVKTAANFSRPVSTMPNMNGVRTAHTSKPPSGLFFSSTAAIPVTDQAHSPEEFKFTGLDEEEEEEEFPEIYVPESDNEETDTAAAGGGGGVSHDGEVALANTSAWSSELSGARGKGEAVAALMGQSEGDAGMWVEAKSEKDAQSQRDADRKLEEERLLKAKADLETERQLAQQAAYTAMEQDRKEDDKLAAEEQARRLEQQREDERLRRQNLTQTVVVDNSAEMMMLEDV